MQDRGENGHVIKIQMLEVRRRIPGGKTDKRTKGRGGCGGHEDNQIHPQAGPNRIPLRLLPNMPSQDRQDTKVQIGLSKMPTWKKVDMNDGIWWICNDCQSLDQHGNIRVWKCRTTNPDKFDLCDVNVPTIQ